MHNLVEVNLVMSQGDGALNTHPALCFIIIQYQQKDVTADALAVKRFKGPSHYIRS